METIEISRTEYLKRVAQLPIPYWMHKEVAQTEELRMMYNLKARCDFKGSTVYIVAICEKVVKNAQKTLLKNPYALIKVAGYLVNKSNLIPTDADQYDVVAYHVINAMNELFETDRQKYPYSLIHLESKEFLLKNQKAV